MSHLHVHDADKAAATRRPGSPSAGRRRFLGEMLVQQGIISNDQLQEVLKLQEAEKGARIGRLLIDHAYVTETQLAELIADQLRIPCVDVAAVSIAPEIIKLLPRELAVKHLCLPWFKERRQIGLVMADPTNVSTIDAVGFALGLTVQPLVAAETQVVAALARYYGADELAASVVTTFEQIDLTSQLALVDEVEPDRHADAADALTAANTGPVIKLVNGILADAIRAEASDIHIEPQEKGVALRYRVDGALRHVITMPKRAQLKIASRVKIMAHMDIAERRKPQDGRMRLVLDGAVYNLRVSTLPTADGEKLVIRILVQSRAHGKLEDLGFEADVLASLKELLRRPQGMILVTGPTGSGKTSTLYASLNVLRDETRNIVTIEDPIEYRLPGVSQVAVAEKAGLTFAAGLRSILRQDPDIVMVGEIRDPETAKVAFQAAQTGHLVLATLHTNDAASAVTRLLEMGVPAYLVASSVIAVQAQRLVRRFCSCRTADTGGTDGTPTPTGCEACRSTGLRGRTGIFELLRVTPKVRAVLLSGGSDDDIRAAAVASGMRTMFEDGQFKVKHGVTDMSEVLRVVLPPEQSESVVQAAIPAA